MSESVLKRLENGVRYHEAGELLKAEQIYRQLLADDPEQVDALHLLGLLAYQTGKASIAADMIGQAVRLRPDAPGMLVNYGEVLRLNQRFAEALDVLQRAIDIDPKATNAHHNLGTTLLDIGRPEQAARAFQLAVQNQPSAIESRWQLIALLIQAKRLDDALEHARILAGLVPDNPQVLQSLGVILNQLDRLPEAEATLRRAVALAPKLAIAYNDLGSICLKTYRIDDAIDAWKKAIEADPQFDWPYNNIAGVLKDAGRIEEAIDYFRKALQLNPSMPVVHSNLLLTLHYAPDAHPDEILEEHRRWQALHRPTIQTLADNFTNSKLPNRRLRVGYVSADFRSHSVADFFESVLPQHDKSHFEIVCYSDVAQPDVVTHRLAKEADLWREVAGWSHPQLAEQIRTDGIDILVDLAGHSAHNRMPVFAMKPAPIQVTWLGYPNTTGLDTVDYRITDRFADPVGWNERYHTEQLWRLPNCFLCYHPTLGVPPVGPLPADLSGEITFASFNNFAKLNRPTLRWWATILERLPNARLILKATVLSGEYARKSMLSQMKDVGLDEERVELVGSELDFFKHIAHYHRVDIGLDTFPYHGTTTTCEALWMGVPIVTLAGKVHASRVGVSLLNNVGLQDWVASDPDHYIQLAIDLASDRDRLRAMRAGLRARLASSPLLDQRGFTHHLESAFREMWMRWCRT